MARLNLNNISIPASGEGILKPSRRYGETADEYVARCHRQWQDIVAKRERDEQRAADEAINTDLNRRK